MHLAAGRSSGSGGCGNHLASRCFSRSAAPTALTAIPNTHCSHPHVSRRIARNMPAATVELPAALVLAGGLYIGLSALLGLAAAVLLAPLLIINRSQSRYWDDWNASLRAPWLFWHIGGFWYRFTELLGNHVLPAPQRVADLACAYFRSQVIITLVELGVPDALEKGPKTGSQLAAELRVHQPYLERVLRVAGRMAVVAVSAPHAAHPNRRQYSLTQLSAVLCESHPNSVKHMVALFGDHYAAFGHLAEGVRSGQTPYKLHAKGLSHWEHMRAVPALYERFNKAMTNFNTLCPIEAVFLEYPFSRYARLVDVGGGLGAFLAAALERTPAMTGVLFDLPNVIKQAQQAWRSDRKQLAGRAGFTAGSFFDAGAIPAATSDRDVFAMRQILHDWSDGDSIRILKQVRAAIGDFRGAKLVIVESCLCSNKMTTTHTPRTCGDVHMMVQYGDAKERSEVEFGQLLAAAGFRLDRVIPTKSLFFVLEATPL